MTSIRLAPRTSSTSLIERSWPTASGVSVSGKVTVSRSGRTGSASGSGCVGADRVLGVERRLDDFEDRRPLHQLPLMSRPIGTRRVVSAGSRRGRSMRRIPSS